MMMDGHFTVQTESLTKDYGDGTSVRALEDVSFSIAQAEFIAIEGPSGSGKSPLLNLIGTLDNPTSGRVVIDGVDIGTLKGDALADFRREKIGFVFQLFNLAPTLNALENVMLPLTIIRGSNSWQKEAACQVRIPGVAVNNVHLLERAGHEDVPEDGRQEPHISRFLKGESEVHLHALHRGIAL